MSREQIRPVEIPLALREDVAAAMALIDQRRANSMTTQGIKLDGHLWKIHIYRQDDSVIVIRLVDKGLQ